MSETKITPHMQSFVDKFVEFSARLANQVHLRSLRDAFATVMPIFILAGLAVLVNNVVFPWIFHGDTLRSLSVGRGDYQRYAEYRRAAAGPDDCLVAGAQQRFRQSGLGSGYRRQQFYHHDADAPAVTPVGSEPR
jgi:hypothetical protein